MNTMNFTFSDTIAGYVTAIERDQGIFRLKTTDEREFQVKLTSATYGQIIQNLNEPFQDPGTPLATFITPGMYLFAYGVFYPEAGGHTFEAKRIIFTGREPDSYRFESPDWWIQQIRALADFYFHAQFPNGVIDYQGYRTHLTLEGQKIEGTRQETDTISRMIYGFATAYMLTGEERYLEAANKGTEYLRDHLRAVDESADVVYWYHAMDVQGGKERKIFASMFGDDYEALPAYEQIYALAGPIQTYRVTGDPRILHDAEKTVKLFKKFYRDPVQGGYFSHIDPLTFDPRATSLGNNRARKNWNSVGDHAPAYLINLWLATGEQQYADFLIETANTIEQHFPDYEHSPFVQERFHEDWSHDTDWNWQQNRAVVGHNLKIAWNLIRISHLQPQQRYIDLARKIARIMPTVGLDRQRGGWYDVVERTRQEHEEWHRFVWHDRKAWWQQEQAILAYLILYGSLKDPQYLRLARESIAFYNAFFPDQDNGGVYFNVTAPGVPYLVGTERLKGSHSMSGYHSFELCYLAAVYSNLLINKQPMDLYFKPQVGAFKDNVLRIQPDILPPGSVRIERVWLNGDEYKDFDAEKLTINLPRRTDIHNRQRPAWSGHPYAQAQDLQVRVRLIPATTRFDITSDITNGIARLTLYGDLDTEAVVTLKTHLDTLLATQPSLITIDMEALQSICNEAGRTLSIALEKFPLDRDITVIHASSAVQETLKEFPIWEELTLQEAVNASISSNARRKKAQSK